MADNKKKDLDEYEIKSSKQSIKDSKIGAGLRDLKKVYLQNKNLVRLIAIASLIVLWLVIGFLTAELARINHRGMEVYFGTVVEYGFKYSPAVILAWVAINLLILKFMIPFIEDSTYDDVMKVTEAGDKSRGLATRMKDGKEKDEVFVTFKAFTETYNIYGRDRDHPDNLIALNPDLRGVNPYSMIVCFPGGGKSRCHVIPNLFQIIRRGESCIVTDTKASLYGLVKMVAEAHGYKTHFINFDPEEMVHSDAVNLFEPATRNDIACLSFARAVIDNLGSNREVGFWPKAEANLLTAVMLLIKNDTTRAEKSLSEVARVLNNNSTPSLVSLFMDHQKEGSVMTGCANNWINSGERVKDDARSGLAMDFTRLIDPVISTVISKGEVDMTLPGREKCMYFVNLSDTDRSMDFLSALFFQEIIKELEKYADNQPNQRCKVPVTLLFEEFANIGKLPDWDNVMNTIRSRGITPILILQAYEQLEKNYPDSADAIRGACATQILLGTNLEKTAEWWSNRSGTRTIKTVSTGTVDKVTKFVRVHKEIHTSVSTASRPTYDLGDIYRVHSPYQLVAVSGFNVCEMERLDMSNHPMMAEVRQIDARRHLPEWVKAIDERELLEYGIDPKTFHDRFKTDEEMMIEAGIDPTAEPYICTPEDFKHFYKEKKKKPTMLDKNDKMEQNIVKYQRRLDKARARDESVTASEVEDMEDISSLDDMFSDEDE